MREALDVGEPSVHESAYISQMSYLIGDVTVGERAAILPFVCLRGDSDGTVVGDESNVQEFSMIHGGKLGRGVTVGHGAVVDYATVEDDALIGMQSSVLRDAVVESNCIVAANAVVTQGQTIPAGHLAYGTPAKTRPLTDAQLAEIERVHEHYVELGQQFKAALSTSD